MSNESKTINKKGKDNSSRAIKGSKQTKAQKSTHKRKTKEKQRMDMLDTAKVGPTTGQRTMKGGLQHTNRKTSARAARACNLWFGDVIGDR